MREVVRATFAAFLAMLFGFSATAELEVFVTVPPQACLAERIGGNKVRVEVLVQPGQEAHTYEPTPRQVMALASSDIFFTIGLPLEDRVAEKIRGGKGPRVADSIKGIERVPLDVNSGHGGHRHDGHGEHNIGEHEAAENNELDPHVWLSPPLLEKISMNMAEAMMEADPANAELFKRNLAALNSDIADLDAELREAMAPLKGHKFYVHHPAFGYFAATYGLVQVAVESEGKDPTPRRLRELIASARQDEVKVIFVQPQFDPKSAEAVADAIGGSVVPADPLARDVIGNLREIARRIAEGGAR